MLCTLTPDPDSGTQRDFGSDDFTEPFQLERKDVADVVSELAETSGTLLGICTCCGVLCPMGLFQFRCWISVL